MNFQNVEPLHTDFGAQITGLDLSKRLSKETIFDIQEAIDRYSFLCFPDQSVRVHKVVWRTRAQSC